MIGAARQWLTSIVMVTFLISLLRILTPEGMIRKIGTFTGSLALMAAILGPLARLNPEWPELRFGEYETEIERRVEEWNIEQERDFQTRVGEKIERLIEEQAAKFGVTAGASVELRVENGTPLPWSVTLTGTRNASLSAWMESALNVPPERQYWTGK